jgi:hypothetical protein
LQETKEEEIKRKQDDSLTRMLSPKKISGIEKPLVPVKAKPVLAPKPVVQNYVNYFEGTNVNVLDLIAASCKSMPSETEMSLPVTPKAHPFPRVPLLNTQHHFSSFNLNVLFFIIYRLQKMQPQ